MEEKLTCSHCEITACKLLHGVNNQFVLSQPGGVKYSKTVSDEDGHGLLQSETVTISVPATNLHADMTQYNRRWYTLRLKRQDGTWKSVGSYSNPCQIDIQIDGSDATITFTTQKAIL